MASTLLIKTGEFSYKKEHVQVLEKENRVVYVDSKGQEIDKENIIWLNRSDRDILDNVFKIAFDFIVGLMPDEMILSKNGIRHFRGIMDAYFENLYSVAEEALEKTRKDIESTNRKLPHLNDN